MNDARGRGRMGGHPSQGIFLEKGLIGASRWNMGTLSRSSKEQHVKKQTVKTVTSLECSGYVVGSKGRGPWGLGSVGRSGRGQVTERCMHAKEAKERHRQICTLRVTTLMPLWSLDGKDARLGASAELGERWS